MENLGYTPECILITGAAGFIAGHVCNRLVQRYPQYKIVVLDKLDYCSSLKNIDLSKSSPNFKFVKGDIGSADLVNYLLLTEGIDTIMHFAAQTHVDNSFGNSFEFTKNNIYGTHVLLEACKVAGTIKRFIHVSTDEVYGETDADAKVGNHEASQLLPTNPYSATKAGAEMLVMAYGQSYNIPFITTRGNNVYGPQQFPEKLIPKFMLLAMQGKELPIHGDGSNVRSYLYCEDVAEAFDCVLHKGTIGHVYNIGTKRERRVIDVARDICKLLNIDAEKVIKFVENRPFNDQRYYLDDAKLIKLGWNERTMWEEGLKKTLEWYQKNPSYWGDISGALLPHPKFPSTYSLDKGDSTVVAEVEGAVIIGKGIGKGNEKGVNGGVNRNEKMNGNGTETATVTAAHVEEKTTMTQAENGKPEEKKSEFKFLIYGKSGWIGGLLADLCKAQGIPYEFGQGRLEDRASIEADIAAVKPTHVFNAAGVTGRPNVDWCESNKVATIRANMIGCLTLADVTK